jgi:hypothetical protein
MLKDNKEGQTHFYGDNCGCTEHNPTIKSEEERLKQDFYEFSNPRKYEQLSDIHKFFPQRYNEEIANYWLQVIQERDQALRKEVEGILNEKDVTDEWRVAEFKSLLALIKQTNGTSPTKENA